MCNLCSNDPNEREKARKYQEIIADDLERLAANYRDMAHGRIKPHTDAAKIVALRATSLVRHLVDEWV